MDLVNITKLFVSAKETKDPEEAPINGEFPEWLKGSLYQTGPGLFDLPNFTMNDYLDGYAILSKFEIGGPTVKLMTKYPKTESYTKAVEMGKPYFLEYGTTAKREGSKGGFLSKLVTTFSRDDMSDNCSASIYQCGGHLIASSATTFFSKINPTTLQSVERYDAKKSLSQNGYGVHPLTDSETGNMWNMGFSVLPTVKYTIVKIPRATSTDVEMENLLAKGSTVASISPRWNGGLSFNHSFGMTKHYIVFIEQPYVIKISRVLSATLKDYAVKDWLEWRGAEKNRFVIIEKSTGKVFSTEYLSTESFFFLHIINCYEEGNTIVMDIATSKTPSSTGATSLAKLRSNIIDEVDTFIVERFIIPVIESVKAVPENCNLIQTFPNTQAQAIRKGNTVILQAETVFSQGAERTSINPQFIGRKHSFLYATGSFLSLKTPHAIMAHSICKVNAETKETKVWTASNDHYPGEPIFIARNPALSPEDCKEDDGVIVAAMSSTTESSKDFLVVIDGLSFREIARANFDTRIPAGMHALFLPN